MPRHPTLALAALAGLAAVAGAATGCKSAPEAPAAPAAETSSPADSPLAYKVLDDRTVNNAVEYHVLIADGTRHDDVEKLLKYLYRHLVQRREDEPAALAAYVYSSEAAFRSPPRAPVAQVVKKSGDRGPTFEDKVPLEFSQEVELAVHPLRENEAPEAYALRRASEDKAQRKPRIERDDAARTVTVTVPYTEAGKDGWAETLSFNQAMNTFTDLARSLFDSVADLKQLTYAGVWKDKEVVRIAITRADYSALKLNELEERIGQHHGRVFLELATSRSNDAKAARDQAALVAKEYKAMLAQLKGKARVDPALK